ncbi:MAG TPA: hydroxyacid dehydrogenase, partial [Rhodobacteraceae bacterium]|nr:hydroxyacid dehydrogenase [Paracoccaceae bacterium]
MLPDRVAKEPPVLNPVSQDLIDALRASLPAACFRPIEPRYLEEPRGRYIGQAGVLLAPATVEDVALIVLACNRFKVGIVPYGGGTSLVAG